MPASIIINQISLAPGVAGRARSDGVVGQLVTCSNATPESSYLWTLVDVPIRSSLTRGTTGTGATFTFTPDVKGTYLVSLRVNNSSSESDNATTYFAIRSFGPKTLGWRYKACGETFEDNEVYPGLGFPSNINVRGWATDEDLVYEVMEEVAWEVKNAVTDFTGTTSRLVKTDPVTGQIHATLIPGAPPSGSAGGDLTGSYPNPTVAAIRGRRIAPSLLPQNGETIWWNSETNQFQIASQLRVTPNSISASANLLPTADLVYDLGSPVLRWKTLYAENLDVVNLPETDLQRAYEAGPAPEIATDLSRGPVSIKTHWDPTSGETIPNAIVLRLDAGPLGILEGLSLSPAGLSSAEDIEIKPAEAPTGEAGKVLRLRGGDSSDHPTGGHVSIDAGSGHSGQGEVQINTGGGNIVSGSINTRWEHLGSLQVGDGIESSEVQTRELKTLDNLTVDVPISLTLNAGEINSGMSSTPWNHSGDLSVTGTISAQGAVQTRELKTPDSLTVDAPIGLTLSAETDQTFQVAGFEKLTIDAEGLKIPDAESGQITLQLANNRTGFSADSAGLNVFRNGTRQWVFGHLRLQGVVAAADYYVRAIGVGSSLIIGGRVDREQDAKASLLISNHANLPFVGHNVEQQVVKIESQVGQTGSSTFTGLEINTVVGTEGSGGVRPLEIITDAESVMRVDKKGAILTKDKLYVGALDQSATIRERFDVFLDGVNDTTLWEYSRFGGGDSINNPYALMADINLLALGKTDWGPDGPVWRVRQIRLVAIDKVMYGGTGHVIANFTELYDDGNYSLFVSAEFVGDTLRVWAQGPEDPEPDVRIVGWIDYQIVPEW